MDIRHFVVLLPLWVLSCEWVQNPPSRLMWICNGYTACGSFVCNMGPGQSVSVHHPSRLMWMCNGYTACRHLVGTTGPGRWVSAPRPSRLVWMRNGYTAFRGIVATMGPVQWVILKEIFQLTSKRNRQKFPNGCNAKRGIAAAREKQ